METDLNKCSECKIKSNAVSILDKSELKLLETGCSQTNFRKGEMIFKEGSPSKYIVFIRKGFAKLFKRGHADQPFILSIAKAGAYLGIQNLNRRNKVYYYSAVAITDVKVCFIDIESFDILLKKNGVFASEVINYIFSDEMNYFDRLINSVQQQLPGRLAGTLLYFRNQVYNENPFNINLTKSELASLIGTSRESVHRLIKDFQISGIIKIENNLITIIDEKKLEEIKRKG